MERPGLVDVRIEGSRCPYCRETIPRGEAPAVCADCHALHHRECFDEAGGCAACHWVAARPRATGGRGAGAGAARFEVTSARLPAPDAQLLAFSPGFFYVGMGLTGLVALAVGLALLARLKGLGRPPDPEQLLAGFAAIAITCLAGFLATVFAGLLLGTPLRPVRRAEDEA